MITANSVLCALLAIYHLISNTHSWIIVNYYSFKIFQCFRLTPITQLLLHNQLALKIYGRCQQYTALSHWFDGVFTWKQGWLMVYCICLEKRQLGQSELKKWLSRLSEDEIAEFLTKTEQNKYKYEQNIKLHECYKYLFLRSISQRKQYSVYILKLCRHIGQSF